MEEFCSSEIIGGAKTVRCLNDEGNPERVNLNLEEMAKRLDVPAHCIVIKNEIGVRRLDDLAGEWKSVITRCSGVLQKQKILVTLTLERSKDEPDAAFALVNLSIPAIGFNKRLGQIWNFPLCNVSRMKAPVGIAIGCSDNSESYAQVYRYGSNLFYRVEESEDERNMGVGPAIQSVELPCSMEPVFRFRSSVPLNSSRSD